MKPMLPTCYVGAKVFEHVKALNLGLVQSQVHFDLP